MAVRSPVDVEAASAVDAAAPWPDVEAGGLDSGGFEGGVVTCTSLTELAVEDARAGSPARPCSAPPGTAGTPSGSVVGETPAPGHRGHRRHRGHRGRPPPGNALPARGSERWCRRRQGVVFLRRAVPGTICWRWPAQEPARTGARGQRLEAGRTAHKEACPARSRSANCPALAPSACPRTLDTMETHYWN